MKTYKVGDREFILDYKSLDFSYNKYNQMSDEEFLDNIIDVLHYACYVCWLKNIPSSDCLSDEGIIHELIHLASDNTKKHVNISRLREKIKKNLRVSKKNVKLFAD